MNNIFFSADTHIGHKNVLKYMPSRPYALEQDTKAHDKWLIKLWQKTIGKQDRIYFRKASQIMDVTIKPSVCNFIKEELRIVLCYYQLLDRLWKHQGVIMLHGHCHCTMDDYNAQSTDLQFDIGIDSVLAKREGGFIYIKTLYKAIMEKINKNIQKRIIN